MFARTIPFANLLHANFFPVYAEFYFCTSIPSLSCHKISQIHSICRLAYLHDLLADMFAVFFVQFSAYY